MPTTKTAANQIHDISVASQKSIEKKARFFRERQLSFVTPIVGNVWLAQRKLSFDSLLRLCSESANIHSGFSADLSFILFPGVEKNMQLRPGCRRFYLHPDKTKIKGSEMLQI
jgi:hypothetical protein